MPRRSWWREYFRDHLLYNIGGQGQPDPSAFVKPTSGNTKIKVYCKLCLDHDIAQIKAADEEAVHDGTRATVRTVQEIELICTCTTSERIPSLNNFFSI